MINRIRKIVEASGKGRGLMGLVGKYESELMVWQTLSASIENHSKHGQAFSLKSRKLREVTGGGLGDNPEGYRILLDRGWIEERRLSTHIRGDDTELDDGLPVGIFPTQSLIEAAEKHLGI